MGQGADAQEVDPGLRHAPGPRQAQIAAGLEEHPPARRFPSPGPPRASGRRSCCPAGCRPHPEWPGIPRTWSRVSASTSSLIRLGDTRRAEATAGRIPPAAAMWFSLSSTPVAQGQPVVEPSPAAHGVLLEHLEPRRVLPGVQDPGARALHGRDEGSGERRRAAQPLEQIQHDPLRHEDGPAGTRDGHHFGAAGHLVPVLDQAPGLQERIHGPEDRARDGKPREHDLRLGHDPRGHLPVGDGGRGPVLGAPVLAQEGLDGVEVEERMGRGLNMGASLFPYNERNPQPRATPFLRRIRPEESAEWSSIPQPEPTPALHYPPRIKRAMEVWTDPHRIPAGCHLQGRRPGSPPALAVQRSGPGCRGSPGDGRDQYGLPALRVRRFPRLPQRLRRGAAPRRRPCDGAQDPVRARSVGADPRRLRGRAPRHARRHAPLHGTGALRGLLRPLSRGPVRHLRAQGQRRRPEPGGLAGPADPRRAGQPDARTPARPRLHEGARARGVRALGPGPPRLGSPGRSSGASPDGRPADAEGGDHQPPPGGRFRLFPRPLLRRGQGQPGAGGQAEHGPGHPEPDRENTLGSTSAGSEAWRNQPIPSWP